MQGNSMMIGNIYRVECHPRADAKGSKGKGPKRRRRSAKKDQGKETSAGRSYDPAFFVTLSIQPMPPTLL